MHPRTQTDVLEFIHVIGAPIDDATRMLRLHGLAEYFLERILIRRLPDGELLVADERFGFHHKLQIVLSLRELNSHTVGALRRLAKLRNRCAHDRRPIVETSEIVEIGEVVGPLFQKAMRDFEGENKEFRALVWSLFTELSHQSTSREIMAEALEKLKIGKST
jgi:hypothetical protein